VVGKLLIIIIIVVYFVIYCLVLHEMIPVGHQNVRSAAKAREILYCNL